MTSQSCDSIHKYCMRAGEHGHTTMHADLATVYCIDVVTAAMSTACMQVNMDLEERDTGHGKEMYQQVDSCWALGDCSANMESPLPALAQVTLLSPFAAYVIMRKLYAVAVRSRCTWVCRVVSPALLAWPACCDAVSKRSKSAWFCPGQRHV